MNDIKRLSQAAHDHLIERDPKTWCKAFFQLHRSCDAFENGISESFNSRIEKSRKKPILTMLEEIRLIVMNLKYKRKLKGQKWNHNVCPKIRKVIEKLKKEQRNWGVYPSGPNQFEVRNGNVAFHVDITEKTCSCRLWQLSGIGCAHSMAALLFLNKDSEKYVSVSFSREMYLNTYQHNIRPMNGSEMWPLTEYINPLPPKARRMPGRPPVKRKRHATETNGKHTMKRKKNPTETAAKQTVTKTGKTVKCGICKQPGHNKVTCKDASASKTKKRDKQVVEGELVQEQHVQEPSVEHDPAPRPRTDPHIMQKLRKKSESIIEKAVDLE